MNQKIANSLAYRALRKRLPAGAPTWSVDDQNMLEVLDMVKAASNAEEILTQVCAAAGFELGDHESLIEWLKSHKALTYAKWEDEFFQERSPLIYAAKNRAERSQRIVWLADGMLEQNLHPKQSYRVSYEERALYEEFCRERLIRYGKTR